MSNRNLVKVSFKCINCGFKYIDSRIKGKFISCNCKGQNMSYMDNTEYYQRLGYGLHANADFENFYDDGTSTLRKIRLGVADDE